MNETIGEQTFTGNALTEKDSDSMLEGITDPFANDELYFRASARTASSSKVLANER